MKIAEIFREQLIRDGYSENVVKIYSRHVARFFQTTDWNLPPNLDDRVLVDSIEEYLNAIPSTNTKPTIKAALHRYYLFETGHQIIPRLLCSNNSQGNLNDELEKFKAYMEKRGLSKSTIKFRCYKIRSFLYNLNEHNPTFDPTAISVSNISTYLTGTLRHISPASRKTVVTCIRSYCKYLQWSYGNCAEEILALPLNPPV